MEQGQEQKELQTIADIQLILIERKHTLKYTHYRNVMADNIAAKQPRYNNRLKSAVGRRRNSGNGKLISHGNIHNWVTKYPRPKW